MSFKKYVGIGALVGTLLFSACNANKEKYVNATIVKENGTVAHMIDGTSNNNEAKNLGRSYTIQFKINNNLYTANILQTPNSKRSLEGLATAFEVGSEIKVSETALRVYFEKDRVGRLYVDEVYLNNK